MIVTQTGRRKFKPQARRSEERDPRLIIIATEDTKAEYKYFIHMADHYINTGVHVEVLQRTGTSSSPEHVIKMLNDFKRRFLINRHDQLWMVIDVDRWGKKKLSEIAQQCVQKKYFLAVSNPCSDLWFLLHKKSLAGYSQRELREFLENKKTGKRTRLEQELIKIFHGFNKSYLNTNQFIPHVADAIERACKLDKNPDHRWPQELGTRIYKLARVVIGEAL